MGFTEPRPVVQACLDHYCGRSKEDVPSASQILLRTDLGPYIGHLQICQCQTFWVLRFRILIPFSLPLTPSSAPWKWVLYDMIAYK